MSEEVDRILNEVGQAWRSSEPPPPEPDLERITARQSPRWAPLAVAAGVVVLTAGLTGIVVFTHQGADRHTATTRNIDSEVIHDGDPVSATSTLYAASGQPIKLCQTGVHLDTPAVPPSCLGGTIEVDNGAIPASIQWKEAGGIRFTESRYTVRGVWSDGRIKQQSVELASGQPSDIASNRLNADGRFHLPCDVPTSWPDTAFGSPQFRAAEDKLKSDVSQQPERYSGLWVAYPKEAPTTGPDFGPYVIVVGTVGDPAVDQRNLSKIYPYSLCVTRVDYSAAELNVVAKRLETDDGTWHTNVAPDLARVKIDLFVLDQAARDRIGTDADKVIIEPFVHKT